MPELRAGPASAVVDPVGGRIASLVVDGLELLLTRAANPVDHGLFPMVPFAGRLRHGGFRFAGATHQLPLNLPPHAIHGTLLATEWSTTSGDESSWCGQVGLGPPWPLGGWAAHDVRLREDGLELRLEVHNDERPMPATCGWHPWWRRQLERGGELVLDVDMDVNRDTGRDLAAGGPAMYERDGEQIPTGRLVRPTLPPWDDCFTGLRRPPRLRWPGVLDLTYATDLEHWVLFTEPTEGLCAEPQTGPPDAFNLGTGFAVVEPGRPLVAELALRWDRTG